MDTSGDKNLMRESQNQWTSEFEVKNLNILVSFHPPLHFVTFSPKFFENSPTVVGFLEFSIFIIKFLSLKEIIWVLNLNCWRFSPETPSFSHQDRWKVDTVRGGKTQ